MQEKQAHFKGDAEIEAEEVCQVQIVNCITLKELHPRKLLVTHPS